MNQARRVSPRRRGPSLGSRLRGRTRWGSDTLHGRDTPPQTVTPAKAGVSLLSGGRCAFQREYPSFRWGDGLGLCETAVRHTFPSRLREGSGEGATYVLASGFEARPSPNPSRTREGSRSAQASECRLQPRSFGGLVGVVGLGLFHRFGLGAFDEAGVAQAARQRVALLFRRRDRLGQAGAFGV